VQQSLGSLDPEAANLVADAAAEHGGKPLLEEPAGHRQFRGEIVDPQRRPDVCLDMGQRKDSPVNGTSAIIARRMSGS
jgi:hypothetical protein